MRCPALTLFLAFTLSLSGLSIAVAQEVVQQDSSRVVAPPPDTTTVPDSTAADSLSAAERARISFEERLQRAREQAPKREIKPRLSVYDTLIGYFAPGRLNQRDQQRRSYYMTAGDYFKFNPSYRVTRWQLTPNRTTVQPYGLSGDRLSYVNHGLALHPFEHSVEPDGLIDIEDLPTSTDGAIFLMPGPSGMLFGGEQAISTLVTQPRTRESKKVQSGFLLDKGNYAFSHARGYYSNKFSDGRELDLGIGYRVADGAFIVGSQKNSEDAYFYDGNLYLPFGTKVGLNIDGHLYSREGPLFVRPNGGGDRVNRDRFDRNLRATFSIQNDSQTVRTDLGYRHLRQGSYLTSAYQARFNYTGHGVDLSRQWYSMGSIRQVSLAADMLEYDNAYQKYERYAGDFSVLIARPHQAVKWALRAGTKYVEEFRAAPYGSLTLLTESERGMLQLAVGYAERVPTQHELYLPFQTSSLYGLATSAYADSCNADLKKERQVTASARLEFGSVRQPLALEIVGGRIQNAIEWNRELISITTNSAWLFSPVNTDISFATATLTKALQLGELIHLIGGGSYHWIEYRRWEDRPYQPDYNAFGGAELHLYWQSKRIHFWAYGEVEYVGEYEGYDGDILGEEPVFNGKLSFQMGNFRFRLVYQNVLNTFYRNREAFEIPGQVFTWGFDWNFSD